MSELAISLDPFLVSEAERAYLGGHTRLARKRVNNALEGRPLPLSQNEIDSIAMDEETRHMMARIFCIYLGVTTEHAQIATFPAETFFYSRQAANLLTQLKQPNLFTRKETADALAQKDGATNLPINLSFYRAETLQAASHLFGPENRTSMIKRAEKITEEAIQFLERTDSITVHVLGSFLHLSRLSRGGKFAGYPLANNYELLIKNGDLADASTLTRIGVSMVYFGETMSIPNLERAGMRGLNTLMEAEPAFRFLIKRQLDTVRQRNVKSGYYGALEPLTVDRSAKQELYEALMR